MAVTLSELNSCDRPSFVKELGGLFEHSPWVADATFERRPFRDGEHLFRELCASMRRAPRERRLALIRAHPDLAGRLAQQGRLTADSAMEQASAGLDRLQAGEAAEMERLNAAYVAKFGFSFVICARLKDKGAILEAMRRRLGNASGAEEEAALAEIEKIADLRLRDRLQPATVASA